MSNFVNFREAHSLFFSCMKQESFIKQPNHKQRQKLKYALDFVLTLAKGIPEMSSIIVKNLLGVVLDIRLTISNDDCGIKNIAAGLISTLAREANSSIHPAKSESSLPQLILLELEKIVQTHLGFYVEETFQLLIALSTLNKNLIENLLPSIEVSVREIETKRGLKDSDGGLFQKRLNDLKRRIL